MNRSKLIRSNINKQLLLRAMTYYKISQMKFMNKVLKINNRQWNKLCFSESR